MHCVPLSASCSGEFFMMVEKFSLMGCEIVRNDVSVFSTEEKLLKLGERLGDYSVTIVI